ncbi:MAG: YtxH domain-containing protein [Anaerolineae bacterium]|nr:YtxH domain-containing protein [Anaerolineae bacterium]
MDKKSAFFVGCLVGGIAGWVFGILSAPQSGKETLESLEEKAIELRERAEEAAEKVKEKVLGPLESTKDLDADYTR